VKTLAVRLDEQLHAQLHSASLLEGPTVTDVVRSAIRLYIDNSNNHLRDKAEVAIAQIESEAAERRSAINELFSCTDSLESRPLKG
jgi:hypothetical protein